MAFNGAGKRMTSDSQTLYPLAEEGVDETVFPVVVKYESVGREPVNRPLHRKVNAWDVHASVAGGFFDIIRIMKRCYEV